MPEKPFAVVGSFDTPAKLYSACEAIRDAGFQKFDAHTPFPVHGLERAMGVRPTRLPWIVLACGLTGLVGAFTMQWWMGGIDYPMVVSGKPPFAAQSSVPIGFELTVLLSAFGCFFGMWASNGLPRFYHPIMKYSAFTRASDDRFLISVEASDPKFESAKVRQMLSELGAEQVEEVTP